MNECVGLFIIFQTHVIFLNMFVVVIWYLTAEMDRKGLEEKATSAPGQTCTQNITLTAQALANRATRMSHLKCVWQIVSLEWRHNLSPRSRRSSRMWSASWRLLKWSTHNWTLPAMRRTACGWGRTFLRTKSPLTGSLCHLRSSMKRATVGWATISKCFRVEGSFCQGHPHVPHQHSTQYSLECGSWKTGTSVTINSEPFWDQIVFVKTCYGVNQVWSLPQRTQTLGNHWKYFKVNFRDNFSQINILTGTDLFGCGKFHFWYSVHKDLFVKSICK